MYPPYLTYDDSLDYIFFRFLVNFPIDVRVVIGRFLTRFVSDSRGVATADGETFSMNNSIKLFDGNYNNSFFHSPAGHHTLLHLPGASESELVDSKDLVPHHTSLHRDRPSSLSI